MAKVIFFPASLPPEPTVLTFILHAFQNKNNDNRTIQIVACISMDSYIIRKVIRNTEVLPKERYPIGHNQFPIVSEVIYC